MENNNCMKELELFLKEHPHLVSYQNRLEKEMNSVSEEYRSMVLIKHILCNLNELETELKLLQLKLIDIKSKNESNS